MKHFLIALSIFTFGCKSNEPTIESLTPVADIEGNEYHTVKIGSQTWMAENLKTSLFNDENIIPLVLASDSWEALTTPAYTWYNNDESKYKSDYGALYNWYAVDAGKLCPTGWHVPSDEEWKELIDYLGPSAGGKLKEAGLLHWESPNAGATNETGFTALPGGARWLNGEFNKMVGWVGNYWSSTEFNEYHAYGREFHWFDDGHMWFYDFKYDGFSVRCVKD